jgi:hypothetical protein
MSLDSSDSDLDAAYGPAQASAAPQPIDDLDAAYPPPKKKESKDEPLYNPEAEEATALAEGSQGLASVASAGAGTLLGGFRYAMGLDKNPEDVAKVARAFTYEPSTQGGRDVAGLLSKGASYLGQKEGEAAGEWVLDKTGSPVLASAANTLSNVPQFLIPEALGRVTRAAETPTIAAQDIVNKAHEAQSLGAAGVATDVSKASPGIQQAVVESGGDIHSGALNRHIQADSLPIPAELTKGQARQDPGLISDEQNARGGEAGAPLRDRFASQNQNLIENLDEIRREAAPTAVGNDHVQNGQALLDKYKDYDEPIKADISAKYKALADANGGDLPVDGNSYVNSADAALKKANKARYLPPEIRGTLDDLREGGNFTFDNFENLRTDLAAAVRKADRAGDGNAKAAINIARNTLEQLPLTGGAAALKPLADVARSAAKARFDAIGRDPAYEAAVNDDAPKGDSPLANKFVQKYVLGGTKSGLQEMQRKFANDPDASGTIKAAALNYLKNKAGIDAYTNAGNFSQSGFNKARAELEPHMDQLLDQQTATHVRNLGDVARYEQMQPKGSYVNNSNTFTAALGRGIKGTAEQALNFIPGPIKVGSALRDVAAKQAEARKVREALAPGAGIKND